MNEKNQPHHRQRPAAKAALRAVPAALALAAALSIGTSAHAGVSVAITIAPPPLPYYVQPPIPGDGYLWTPGYWSWDPDSGDYVWVPGTWVLPPSAGVLWTPGYWAFAPGGYFWHAGYWGRRVGYYGGIDYGYGYRGHGYDGGRWDHGRFAYNRAVNNLPPGHVHRSYDHPMPPRAAGPDRESFNGGDSHLRTPPTADERRFAQRRHDEQTSAQKEHEQRAFSTPEQRMANNHGTPPTAATPRPSGFGEPGFERGRNPGEMPARRGMREPPREVRAPQQMQAPQPVRQPAGTMQPQVRMHGGGGPEGGVHGGGERGGRNER
jgi:hypothetical protein